MIFFLEYPIESFYLRKSLTYFWSHWPEMQRKEKLFPFLPLQRLLFYPTTNEVDLVSVTTLFCVIADLCYPFNVSYISMGLDDSYLYAVSLPASDVTVGCIV